MEKATPVLRTWRARIERYVPLRILLFWLLVLVVAGCSDGGCTGCSEEDSSGGLPPLEDPTKRSGAPYDSSVKDVQSGLPLNPIPHPVKGGTCTDKYGHDSATCSPMPPFLNFEAIPFRLTADPVGGSQDTGFAFIQEKLDKIIGDVDMLTEVINSALDPNEPVADEDLWFCQLTIYIRDTSGDGIAIYFDPMDSATGHSYVNKCSNDPNPYVQLPLITDQDTVGLSLRLNDFSIELAVEGSCGINWIRFSAKVVSLGESNDYDYCGDAGQTPVNDVVGRFDPMKRTELTRFPSILDADVAINDLQFVDEEIIMDTGCGWFCNLLLDWLLNDLGLGSLLLDLFKGELLTPIEDAIQEAVQEMFPIDVMGLMTGWTQPTMIPKGTNPAIGDQTCGGATDVKWCTPECHPDSARYYGVMGGAQSLIGMALYPHLDVDNQGFLLPFDFGMKPVTSDLSLLKSADCYESLSTTNPPNPTSAAPVKFNYLSFNGTNYHMAFGMSQDLLAWIMYQLYVSGSFCMEIPDPNADDSSDEEEDIFSSFDPTMLLNPASLAFSMASLEMLVPAVKNFASGDGSQTVMLRTLPRGTPTAEIGAPMWSTSTTTGSCPDFICNANETADSCPQDCRADFEFTLPNYDIDIILKGVDGSALQRLMSVRTKTSMQVALDYFTGEGFCPRADSDSTTSDPVCTPSVTVNGKDCKDPVNAATCCSSTMEFGCSNDEFGTVVDCATCASSNFTDAVACQGLDDNDGTDEDDACLQFFVDTKLDIESVRYLDVNTEPDRNLTDTGGNCLTVSEDTSTNPVPQSLIDNCKQLRSGLAELLGEMLEMAMTASFSTKIAIPGIKLKFLHMGPEPMTKLEGSEGQDGDGNGAKDFWTAYARFEQFDIIELMIGDLLTGIEETECDSDTICETGEDESNCLADCFDPNNDTCVGGEEALAYGPTVDCKCGDAICQTAGVIGGQNERYGTCSDCGPPPVCGNGACEGCEALDATCSDGQSNYHCTQDCFGGDGVCSSTLNESIWSTDPGAKSDCLLDCNATSEDGGSSLFAPVRAGVVGYQSDINPGAPDALLSLLPDEPPSDFIQLDARTTADRGITPLGGTVYVHYTDDRDRGAKYTWRNDEGPWEMISAEPAIHLRPQLEGEHRVEVQAVDTDHNVDPTPAVVSYVVDTQGPAIRVIGPQYPSPETVELRVALADAVSKEDKIHAEWSLGGGEYSPLASDRLVNIAGLPDQTSHALLVRAFDEAENKSFTQYHFTVSYPSHADEGGLSCGCDIVPGSGPLPWGELPPAAAFVGYLLFRRRRVARRP
ncbi:MAG: hypothetical protein HYY13_08005 [Nitrospirae bacterium]|nr:hypothetical protein [Nitrospirota bacterium]